MNIFTVKIMYYLFFCNLLYFIKNEGPLVHSPSTTKLTPCSDDVTGSGCTFAT